MLTFTDTANRISWKQMGIGVLFLIVLAFIAIADEVQVPKFKSPPIEFTNRHEITYKWDNNRTEQVDDLLLIGDVTDKKLTFYVKTIGNNHHMCYATGDAQKEGDRYLFIYQQCRLQIKFDTNKAMLSDVGEQCQKYFCGMMGYIQSEFRKQ